MQQIIVNFILEASNFPPILAGLFAIIFFKKIDEKLYSFKIFLLFNLVVQIIQYIMFTIRQNNLFLLHIDVPVEFALLAHFYYSFFKTHVDKKIFITLITCFLLFSIINSIFLQPINTFNSKALFVESLLLIILSVFAFILLLDPRMELNKLKIGKVFSLINTGIFVNALTTLLISYFSNYLIKNTEKSTFNYIWIYNDLASMTMFSLFIIALWKNVNQK